MMYEKALIWFRAEKEFIKSKTDPFGIEINYDPLDTAIKALELQIPKKPRYNKWNSGTEYWYCPTCNEVVLAKLRDKPIENEYNHSHCGGCGQSLDWSDEK